MTNAADDGVRAAACLPPESLTCNRLPRIPPVSLRIAKRSALIPAFKDWPSIFPNATPLATLTDRLTHHSDVTLIAGQSYHVRESEQEAAARQNSRPPKTS